MPKHTIISFAVSVLLGVSAHAACTIRYSCGAGASGTKPANQTISTATKVFTPSAPGTCAKDGYVFSHWQVSSTSGYLNGGDGTMYDAAWAGTEYTIPFTTANDTCSNSSALLTLTAQWIDANYINIPTSKSYTDAGLNAKQPQFANLGNNKLMLYSDTTNGAVASRDIVTTLGTSTSATSVPTIGAINTALATKQSTLNGTAGWVVENTGTPGIVKAKPIYSTTDNYKSALVTVGDLNTAIINAVNSGLTQVADGWQINSSVTLPTLRSYVSLDPDIDGLGYCFQGLEFGGDGGCTMALYDSLGHMSGRWGVSFEYGDIAGKSVCSATEGTENVVATDAQNGVLDGEFITQTGIGESALSDGQKYCWCKMESVDGAPAASRWVPVSSFTVSFICAEYCAEFCTYRVYKAVPFRTVMFDSVQ